MPATAARLIWQASSAVSAATPLPTWAVAGTIWSLVGVILMGFAGLAMLEGLTYYFRQPPITWHVRSALSTHVVLGVLIGLSVFGFVVAGFVHFIVDPSPTSPP